MNPATRVFLLAAIVSATIVTVRAGTNLRSEKGFAFEDGKPVIPAVATSYSCQYPDFETFMVQAPVYRYVDTERQLSNEFAVLVGSPAGMLQVGDKQYSYSYSSPVPPYSPGGPTCHDSKDRFVFTDHFDAARSKKTCKYTGETETEYVFHCGPIGHMSIDESMEYAFDKATAVPTRSTRILRKPGVTEKQEREYRMWRDGIADEKEAWRAEACNVDPPIPAPEN